MKIHCTYNELTPVSSLKPSPKNRNKHSQEQIERLAKILEYQGWRYPIKVSNQSGFITSGHGRLLAAKSLGQTEVPVNFQDYESEEQEYADIQADNAIASWAELDLTGINTDLEQLGPNFDLDMLGIKDFVLEPADKYGDQDADSIPGVQSAVVSPGELYHLGNHRLLCGDSTDAASVSKLMNGEKADMVFTDPPFNIGFKYNSHDDASSDSEYEAVLRSVLENPKVLMLNGWSNIPVICKIRKPTHIGCWFKSNSATPSAVAHFSKWQPIFFFGQFPRGRSDDFFDFHVNSGFLRDPEAGNHSCPLPMSLVDELLTCYGEQSVFEPFCGSGTTLIACEKTNRKCYGMEIDPIYCGVILDRWAKFTGKDPIREDGKSWSEVKLGHA